jgi:4'-phosphopantetheinyl transferase
VWCVDLGEAGEVLEAIEAAEPRLGAEEAEKLDAVADAGVRRERRAAHIALRILIERLFGRRWRGVAFTHAPSGKPFLAGCAGGFSLSHAEGRAVIALATSGTVGVDVEMVRPVAISEGRRRAIVAAAEALECPSPLPEAPNERFLQAWVRLEAAAKAEGIGIGAVLTRAGVLKREAGARAGGAPRTGERAATWGEPLEIHDLALGAGYHAAVAVTAGQAVGPVLRLPATRAGLEGLLVRADRVGPDR